MNRISAMPSALVSPGRLFQPCALPPPRRRLAGVIRALAPGALILAAALGPDPASALTLRVHPDSAAVPVPNYYATVREANLAAAFGDSIEVSSAGSPYIHTAVMVLKDGVTYRGGFGPDFEGPNSVTYETAIELQLPLGNTDSVLDAGTSGSGTLLAGFTISGGNSSFSGGGLFCGPGTALTVRNCRIVNNYADGIGGGVTIGNTSSATLFNCDLEGNTARLRGGGISVAPGADAASIEFCRIVACSASTSNALDGGGGGLFCASGILFARNTITDCWSGTDGGAVLLRNASGFRYSTGWMRDNTAVRNGGAIFQDAGLATFGDVEIERCVAGQDGGAAYFDEGTSTFRDSFVRDCTATGGGGAFFYHETVGSLLRGNDVSGNQAARGGAVLIQGLPFARSYSVQVESNTFAFNGATDVNAAGGIHVDAGDFLDPVLNNILAFQTDGSAISCFGARNQPNLRSNCLFNDIGTNPDPNYGGSCAGRPNVNGNISLNPRFCDATAVPPQLGLNAFSPCLGAGEGGVDMGAHGGSDCAPIHVEPSSWSRIKSFYR